jgi:hypothetical protein
MYVSTLTCTCNETCDTLQTVQPTSGHTTRASCMFGSCSRRVLRHVSHASLTRQRACMMHHVVTAVHVYDACILRVGCWSCCIHAVSSRLKGTIVCMAGCFAPCPSSAESLCCMTASAVVRSHPETQYNVALSSCRKQSCTASQPKTQHRLHTTPTVARE